MTHSNATDRDGAFATHSAHWGAFSARWDGQDVSILPYAGDPAPSPILANFKGALRHKARILKPMVRRNWLEHGPGPQRREIGDDFVECGWDTALDLLAGELARVRDNFGSRAIYGGSYGWASAGRFHHAQSQIHRFLNLVCGGYVRSVNSYSAGASSVILPHVMGPFEALSRRNVTWDQVRTHTDVVLAFGGMPIKNSMIASGGLSRHVEPDAMREAVKRGTRFISISPLRDDFPAEAKAEWIPIRPGTDVAVMLAMAHTLLAENLCDRAFVDRYTTGFGVFERYLRGDSDAQPKHADWAAAISGIAADRIRDIARLLVRNRGLIAVAHALQRAQYGEQPVWAAAVLAAMVGQIGLPGGGYNYALGAMGHTGRRVNAVPIPTMSQGTNPVREFIPVARISDMLLNPGAPFAYNGRELQYPDIKLVYWAGGNPFHHHQDIHRLGQAFARPDTIVVHELAWTAMARSADIVLPATMTLERDDIGAAATDPRLIAMRQVAPPIGEARDDFAILCDLADRLGAASVFAEGRDAAQWMRHLYEPTRCALAERGWEAPDFEEFWERGELALPSEPDDGGILRRFRTKPEENPLPTPSGKIEIFSETIAGYGYDDCPGHPTWLASTEQPDTTAPLWLVANQPATRLHGQLDFGGYSQSRKIEGREVARMHPDDAAPRGIVDGDVIRIFNARGACLAAAEVTDDVMRGIVNLPTGAWYDPASGDTENPLCLHGNPNVLTRDVGTSRLAQGCCGQITVVDCEKFVGTAPAVRAYEPPIPVKSL
ncbi:molybdopterin guanine dinucleotide-containing S/N-oxide reductase [Bradyrhizobium sp. Leo170]|uniref:molybdopterin guanine dinucleotide-containing S/N-oxide reductase n=1 Tax=Bradyrhizobium sp. Leo170 TaxID=1571199 RepID=UPI00102E9980|nr:molybdopterin guanine dinucleotide-containing S/N-oxide reductase [Bradyrhizobium sp. Leo170]TAI64905.1 Asp-tRNA(Asn)/Glu-tRNA(Gln) amidotransferase GatCAB subunit C [Bradyrhizobium sp. Leo170]